MGAMDPPPGLVPVPLGKAGLLLLTEQEYLAGIRRSKLWRRAQAAASHDDLAAPFMPSTCPTR